MIDPLDNLRKAVDRRDMILRAMEAFLMPYYKPLVQYWENYRKEREN